MTSNIITIGLVILFGIALIGWLIWKNKQDEKLLNPDNQEAVEETMMTQANHKDRI